MLAQWKLRRGFEPLRADCVITRSDGVDLDALLRLEIRDWYLSLLNTAPIEMLATTNIASEIALAKKDDSTATVILPQNCRRIVEFQLSGWDRPARIIDDVDSYDALLQHNPFSRGGCAQPVVVKHHNMLYIYSLPQGNVSITRAMAVMEPTDGTYEMDEAALATINS